MWNELRESDVAGLAGLGRVSRPQRWWHTYQDPFRPVWVIAQITERSAKSIRTWIYNGEVTSACDIRTREVIVDAKEANELHKAKPARKRGGS